jgi:hypothetical protein
VAVFDTRIWLDTIDSSAFRFTVDTGGYAASTIANALKKKCGNLLVLPEGFLVTAEQGPSSCFTRLGSNSKNDVILVTCATRTGFIWNGRGDQRASSRHQIFRFA